MDPKFKKLIEYIARNSEKESALLYPNPNWYLFTVPLLDFLSDDLELGQDQVGEVFNAAREQIEGSA